MINFDFDERLEKSEPAEDHKFKLWIVLAKKIRAVGYCVTELA